MEVLSQVLCFWIWFYSGTIQGDSFANYCEVQLILDGYEAVKKRMHLVYEVNRAALIEA